MKIVLVSTPDKFNSELSTVIELFENGLDTLHLRKPKFSRRRTIDYLRKIPRKYHHKIVLHSHYQLALRFKLKGIHLGKKERHLGFKMVWKKWWYRLRHPSIQITTSFHSLLSLLEDTQHYDYVILSPVFNSSSKFGFNASFGEEQLRKTIQKSKHTVYALGGVERHRVDEINRIGFEGVALSGIIWEAGSDEDKIRSFKDFKDVLEGRKSVLPEVKIKPVKIQIDPDQSTPEKS